MKLIVHAPIQNKLEKKFERNTNRFISYYKIDFVSV